MMRAAPLLLAVALVAAGCQITMYDGAVVDVPPGNSFVVRNVRVFDGERSLGRTNVVVMDGRIASVGRLKSPVDLPVLEGAGRTLLPGFIDSHAHVQGEDALRNALRFGVTTELDMFTTVEFAQSHRPQREVLAKTDLADFYSAGVPVTSTIAGPDGAAAFVRARKAEGSDYINIVHEADAGSVTSISAETLAAVVAAAHAEDLIAVVHVSSLRGARDAVAARADGLAHLFGDQPIDEELAKTMADQNMFVIPTLSLFASLDGAGLGPQLAADPRIAAFLSEGQRKFLTAPAGNDKLGAYGKRFNIRNALETVRRLRAAGVRILAGDDAPNLAVHGVSIHGEMQLLTRAGMKPAEVLEAATRGPAKVFKLSDRGRIASGARADLVLVDGNPLSDIKATRAIVHVFKNGYAIPRDPPPPTTVP